MTKTQQGAVLTQPFNYTLDQWISIIELLKRASSKLVDENNYVRERGERPSSFDEICGELRSAADIYLLRKRDRSQNDLFEKKWTQAATALARARQAWIDAEDSRQALVDAENWRCEPPISELDAELDQKRQRSIARERERRERLLSSLELEAQFFASLRGTAKQEFYDTVLNCWHQAGGQFKRSRAPSGKPSGPTVLFVEAVTTPVMGKSAPGREAICKMIVDHRKRLAEGLAEDP